MSRRPPPQLDASALTAALGGRAPARMSREGRIALIGAVAQALLDGRLPSNEARLFVGGALMAWLEQGGHLERNFLRVRKPQSHNTVVRVWARLRAEQEAQSE
jgi:hypothetical protein